MKKEEINLIAQCFEYLSKDKGLHTVVAFCSPLSKVKSRIRVTRAKNGNGYHVDINRPNYLERKFLKLCKKAKTNPKRFWFRPFAKKK